MPSISLAGPPVKPQPAPAKPTGGVTTDTEARAAISTLIDELVDSGVLTP